MKNEFVKNVVVKKEEEKIMKKEVVEKEDLPLVTNIYENSFWGGSDNIGAEDIRIPKLLLMQALSKLVSEQQVASPGDVVNSVTNEIVGNASSKKKEELVLTIVPIYAYKDWVITKEIKGKQEYFERRAYTPETATLQRQEIRTEFVENREVKVIYENNLSYNLFCLLESEAQDPSALPYLIEFKRTSSNTGKDVNSYLLKAQRANKPFCTYTLKIGAESLTNDKGTFYVLKLRGAENTKNLTEVIKNAYSWFKIISSGKAKVDNSDLELEQELVKTPDGRAYTYDRSEIPF